MLAHPFALVLAHPFALVLAHHEAIMVAEAVMLSGFSVGFVAHWFRRSIRRPERRPDGPGTE